MSNVEGDNIFIIFRDCNYELTSFETVTKFYKKKKNLIQVRSECS